MKKAKQLIKMMLKLKLPPQQNQEADVAEKQKEEIELPPSDIADNLQPLRFQTRTDMKKHKAKVKTKTLSSPFSQANLLNKSGSKPEFKLG